MKVVPLPEPVIDEKVLEVAELILAQVRSGEIVSVAMVGLTRDGGTILMRAGLQNATLLGRISHLQHQILMEF